MADKYPTEYNIGLLMAEIEKCEILCHNCHFKLHWEEDENYKNFI